MGVVVGAGVVLYVGVKWRKNRFMKITFNFNSDHRAFHLVPDDNLELCVLNEMASQAEKNYSIALAASVHSYARWLHPLITKTL